MNVDRRTFLASASAIGCALLLLSRGVLAQMAFNPTGLVTRSEFVARIKDWFYLHNADGTHQSNLQLIRVTDERSDQMVQQFTLTLRSDRQDLAIPTGYYEVAGQPFCLFVKHTFEYKGRQFYRAEFSLLR